MQLSDQLLLQVCHPVLISLNGLPKCGKRGQSLRHNIVLRSVRDFDKESNWHQVKSILFVEITESLHDHQKIVLLGQ